MAACPYSVRTNTTWRDRTSAEGALTLPGGGDESQGEIPYRSCVVCAYPPRTCEGKTRRAGREGTSRDFCCCCGAAIRNHRHFPLMRGVKAISVLMLRVMRMIDSYSNGILTGGEERGNVVMGVPGQSQGKELLILSKRRKMFVCCLPLFESWLPLGFCHLRNHVYPPPFRACCSSSPLI